MTSTRVVAVIQARMGSTRLPGKVLADIAGEPLLAWTIGGVRAIPSVSQIVVATTEEPADDPVASLAAELGVAVHRGSTHDVLGRCFDAVAPFEPVIVLRQTADNPFPDPAVAEQQVRALEPDVDYVGIDGWPLGIAAEVCRFAALAAANAEATDAADREHVTPFLYRQPDRYRTARVERPTAGLTASTNARFTVDTAADLAFARALAVRVGHRPPIALDELEAILEGEPTLLRLNADVAQRPWHVTSA